RYRLGAAGTEERLTFPHTKVDAAGTSNSTSGRLTRQKLSLFQWLVVPQRSPTDKDSGPTDSGRFDRAPGSRRAAGSTKRSKARPINVVIERGGKIDFADLELGA